ncbi:MAG: L-2-hydroxyglutarate oxidase [Zoogloeaceae bacterium]|jgi:L-2-hydroxyglutarate oxidase LhgO|nr:L-2-hydroxyglutarate oxidase [Zoogloeaceae bacterium]
MTTDFLILGAGVIGLAIARELKRRQPTASIVVLEKEAEPGRHSSGRNSGVLHSGLYYAPDSLKARLCRQGAREMAEWHVEHGIALHRCGKILTPLAAEDAPHMESLYARAQANGVRVERLDAQELRELEPETRSATGAALWIPETAVGTPVEVMKTLAREVREAGVALWNNAELTRVDTVARQALLKHGERLDFGYAINAAGLHADRVAHQFGLGRHYALLPFKGLYWQLKADAGIHLRHLIYPVMDLRTLTLGIHTTTATNGVTYLGPTAVPAFGREHYRGLHGVRPIEALRMLRDLGRMFLHDSEGYRQQAWQEGKRYFRHWFLEAVQALLPNVRAEHLVPAAKVGLHPRIFDQRRGALLKDFVIEQDAHSLHILGATSPAWTSAFPFARHICERIENPEAGAPDRAAPVQPS